MPHPEINTNCQSPQNMLSFQQRGRKLQHAESLSSMHCLGIAALESKERVWIGCESYKARTDWKELADADRRKSHDTPIGLRGRRPDHRRHLPSPRPLQGLPQTHHTACPRDHHRRCHRRRPRRLQRQPKCQPQEDRMR